MTSVRKLRMFFPDDIRRENFSLVDVTNVDKYGWRLHCQNIFNDRKNNTEGDFDLMSADINFSKDVTDPGYPDESNSWGLVHALTGLAHRRTTDRHGNRLALGWEVRSFSPELYNDANSTRLYGLLRCLSASPLEGESISACLLREYEEQHGEPPADSKDWTDDNLKHIFREDLKKQNTNSSSVRDAVERLLPRWRRQFLNNVRRGHCKIAWREARAVLDRLKEEIAWMPDTNFFVPIANASGRLSYGLDLFSIFADMAIIDNPPGAAPRILLKPFAKAAKRITTGDHIPTIQSWYRTLIENATRTDRDKDGDLDAAFLSACERGYKAILDSGDAVNMLASRKAMKQIEKGLLFCFLVCYCTIQDQKAFTTETINKKFGVVAHGHTWNRPIQNNTHVFSRRTANDECENLQRAMRGQPHALGAEWGWIQSGMVTWLKNDKRLTEQAKRTAPGLFPPAGS